MKYKSQKSGKNSAYEKMVRERQENRRFAVIGSVIAILFVLILAFGGSSEDDIPVLGPEPGDMGVAPQGEHPLTRYARGVRSIEEMDRLINESSDR